MELKLSHVGIDFHAIAVHDVVTFAATAERAAFASINLYDFDGNKATVFLTPEVAAELAAKLTPAPLMVRLLGLLCDKCGAKFDGWYPRGKIPGPEILCPTCAKGAGHE